MKKGLNKTAITKPEEGMGKTGVQLGFLKTVHLQYST